MTQNNIGLILLRAIGWVPLGVSSTLWSHDTFLPASDHNGVKVDVAFNLTMPWICEQFQNMDSYRELATNYDSISLGYMFQIYLNASKGRFPYALTNEQLSLVIGIASDLYTSYRARLVRDKIFSEAFTELATKTNILPPANIHINIGDITKVPTGLIIHGVNCSGAMGSGVALALLNKYPIVREQFIKAYNTIRPQLGHVDYVTIDQVLTVGNCYTQQTCGSDGKRYADLEAVIACVRQAFEYCKTNGYTLHTPRIASDLGGLSWTYEVFPVICAMASSYPEVNVTVHILLKDLYKL